LEVVQQVWVGLDITWFVTDRPRYRSFVGHGTHKVFSVQDGLVVGVITE
jgi:hypothetical protein